MNAPRTDSTDNLQTEAIRPLAVARKRKARRQRSVPLDFILGTIFCAFLIIVIAGGLWLYRDLTRTGSKTVTISEAPDKPAATVRQPDNTQPRATSPGAADTDAKRLAQERRNQFLVLKSTLEEKGARQWGGDGYAAMSCKSARSH